MIIGVDAGALSIQDERLKVGVYRVTLNLVKELSKIDTKNEYRLYSFLPLDKDQMNSLGSNMRNRVVRPAFAWSAIQLPIELVRHPVDVFLGLSQMLPVSRTKKIGFIFDVGFVRYPQAYPGSLARLQMQTKHLANHADHIVCISQTTKADVCKFYGVSNKKITVSYPGIDERFTLKGRIFKNKNPYFLFVGALKRGKNIPFILKCFAEFLRQYKKPYDILLIGGDYWLDPEIGNAIKSLGLERHVKITGFVSDNDLPSYYRGAEALLAASLWEGFCLPAVEAMACGCPVIYTKSGSLPEIIGDAGIPVEQSEISDYVHALITLVKNHTLKTELQKQSMMRVKKFSWKHFAATVYNLIYEKTFHSNRPRKILK